MNHPVYIVMTLSVLKNRTRRRSAGTGERPSTENDRLAAHLYDIIIIMYVIITQHHVNIYDDVKHFFTGFRDTFHTENVSKTNKLFKLNIFLIRVFTLVSLL